MDMMGQKKKEKTNTWYLIISIDEDCDHLRVDAVS